jgi:3-hydroxyacyl-[acyl-carrier-protein] dehydratase
MHELDFKVRPVAGIAPKIELAGAVHAGQTLEIEVDLESLDVEAVGYSGCVKVDGQLVLRLTHCVGPMVPVEQYDDPAAVRSRYELICGQGATPGGFKGLPPLQMEITGGVSGQTATALLHVPPQADFFTDHFPRRPVFPGTLFMYKVLELAGHVAKDVPANGGQAQWVARQINDSKLRAFMPPGESLEFEAKLARQDANSLTVQVEARKDGRTKGHSKIVFFAEPKK